MTYSVIQPSLAIRLADVIERQEAFYTSAQRRDYSNFHPYKCDDKVFDKALSDGFRVMSEILEHMRSEHKDFTAQEITALYEKAANDILADRVEMRRRMASRRIATNNAWALLRYKAEQLKAKAAKAKKDYATGLAFA